MFDKIFLDSLIGLENVDGQNDQAFAGELLGDVVDQFGFGFAVLAPCGPELEQDDFAFHRRIVELIAGGGFGAEAWSGLASFICPESKKRSERYCDGYEMARDERWRSHGAEY